MSHTNTLIYKHKCRSQSQACAANRKQKTTKHILTIIIFDRIGSAAGIEETNTPTKLQSLDWVDGKKMYNNNYYLYHL